MNEIPETFVFRRGDGGDVLSGFDPGFDRILLLTSKPVPPARIVVGMEQMPGGPGAWIAFDTHANALVVDWDGDRPGAPEVLLTYESRPLVTDIVF